MANNDLSNQSRLNQNIRITSLEAFRNYIGGINGSPALVYDNYFAAGLTNNPNVSKPLEGDEILNLILQSSAEGAYFTRDIMNNFLTSDSDEDIRNAFGTTGIVSNKLIPGKENEKAFKIYPVAGHVPNRNLNLWAANPSTPIESALEDVEVTFKKITKKIDDPKSPGSKITVEGYGTTKPGSTASIIRPNINKKSLKSALPDRINNPTVTAFTVRKGRFSLNARCQDELSLFFNAIPTLEMSKCTPYLSLLIRYPRDKSTEDNMSLGSFLRFVKGRV